MNDGLQLFFLEIEIKIVFNLYVVNTYALSYERRKFTISHYCNRKILNNNSLFFFLMIDTLFIGEKK